MALDANRLGTAIATAIGDLSSEDLEDVEAIWQAIAAEIVNEIKANADVEPGIPVSEGETGFGEGKIN